MISKHGVTKLLGFSAVVFWTLTLGACIEGYRGSLELLPSQVFAQNETQYQYLSGRGKDDPVEWDFFCSAGRKSGQWHKIPVPSQWELMGFGNYNYGKKAKRYKESANYKRTFTIDKSWHGKTIKITFEGVMTDTEVLINGKIAGPIHQGGFYRFSYDITDLLVAGDNLLEVNVSKASQNVSVEKAERYADYWVFGGIFRPVYLEALPRSYIEWNSVDAGADGNFVMDTYFHRDGKVNAVTAQIFTLEGTPLGRSFSARIQKGSNKVRLASKVSTYKTWTAESPNLYKVKIQLLNGTKVVHSMTKRFGFRTFVVKPGIGFFLNGTRIRLKGVNRHSFWPDSGRCLSRKICYDDVRLMKEMNMNAVRMSHYPPDVAFLEACDELGLYVLDELAGWHKPSYDTPTAKRLVAQMVKRDQMHPSIIIWDNANEDGENVKVDDDFALYDIQKRVVIHPWKTFNNIDTKHYITYGLAKKKLAGKTLFLPTEFLHGLYDGGHGAGLNDYWNLLKNSDLGAGGFLWVLTDEGVVRTDKDGWIDTSGNLAPDGIVGPYREREGSFYTIKEIWSPVQITNKHIDRHFDGKLDIENWYDFRNVDSCSFNWEVVTFPTHKETAIASQSIAKGTVKGPQIAAGKQGKLQLNLPKSWHKGDALKVTAINQEGENLFTWSWSIQKPETHLNRALNGRKKSEVTIHKDGKTIKVTSGNFTVNLDATTGMLISFATDDNRITLANGPRIVHAQKEQSEDAAEAPLEAKLKVEKHYAQVTIVNPANGISKLVWKIHDKGYLEMQCEYVCDSGSYDFHGITFDYPEKLVRSKRWLGDGPYRVWKNRMKGTEFGVWQNDYNDTIPGVQWKYPAFKGYFSNINWLQLNTAEGVFTIATDQENLFARVFDHGNGAKPKRSKIETFAGDISFLHCIASAGSKFKSAKDLGPESQKTKADGTYSISLFFFADH